MHTLPTILSKEERCGFQLWRGLEAALHLILDWQYSKHYEITKQAKPDLDALIATLTEEEKADIDTRILTGEPVW